jgi:CRP-like cAMP-binding protein
MSPGINYKVEKFFSQFPLRSYPKGQILIHAGDNPQYIFFLVKGRVRQYDISYRGDEVIVNIFDDHSFFPMLWATTQVSNKYFYDAEIDSEVRLIPYQTLITYLKANPDVLYDLLTRLYVGVDGLMGRMVHLMSGSACDRLLYELIEECKRFGERQKDGSWLVRLNESGLAARAGLTRETVSRELKKINRDYLLEITRGGIIVRDLAQLEDKLGRARK